MERREEGREGLCGWGLLFVGSHFTAARGWLPMTIEAAVVSFALHPLYLHPFSRPLSPVTSGEHRWICPDFSILSLSFGSRTKNNDGSAREKSRAVDFSISLPSPSHSPSRNSLVLPFVLYIPRVVGPWLFAEKKRKGEEELGHFSFQRKPPIIFANLDSIVVRFINSSIHPFSQFKICQRRIDYFVEEIKIWTNW